MIIKTKNQLEFRKNLTILALSLDIHSPNYEKARSFLKELNEASVED